MRNAGVRNWVATGGMWRGMQHGGGRGACAKAVAASNLCLLSTSEHRGEQQPAAHVVEDSGQLAPRGGDVAWRLHGVASGGNIVAGGLDTCGRAGQSRQGSRERGGGVLPIKLQASWVSLTPCFACFA